jgi:methionyl-tRNA formyltransferase
MAVPPLRAIAEAGFAVDLVVTGKDKRRGRGGRTGPSPVKAAATELGLPVAHDAAAAIDAGADLGVVVAYGRLIRRPVLAAVPMVNVHFSLLPRWRGAAPVERAILAGDSETGVCLMAVEETLDTGGVYRRQAVPIAPGETADELRDRLVAVSVPLLVDALRDGFGRPEPQVGPPTYAEKIRPEELHIDWRRPAEDIERLVRVGGAWTTVRGRRLKVWRTARPPSGAGFVVRTGSEPVELLEVQPEGRDLMPAADWARGARLEPGSRLPP